METEWTKTFEITKIESFWSYCPASAEIGIAVVASIAFVVTLKIVIKLFLFLRRKKEDKNKYGS